MEKQQQKKINRFINEININKVYLRIIINSYLHREKEMEKNKRSHKKNFVQFLFVSFYIIVYNTFT